MKQTLRRNDMTDRTFEVLAGSNLIDGPIIIKRWRKDIAESETDVYKAAFSGGTGSIAEITAKLNKRINNYKIISIKEIQ